MLMAGLVRSRYRPLLRTRHEPRFSQKKGEMMEESGKEKMEKMKDFPEFMNLGNSFHGTKPQLRNNCFHKMTGR